MPLNILVVDDQSMIRKIHTDMLLEAGHSVESAADGKEGLDLFYKYQSTTPFDLVMTDEVMPVMTGHELAQKLYQELPGLPIIMISSAEDVELMLSMMRMGISFFRKPLRKQDLYPYLESIASQLKVKTERETEKVEQAQVEQFITSASFTLLMENDKTVIPLLIKYILQFCDHYRISEEVTFRVHFGLEETLINAIAHGNLEMASAEFKKEGNFKLWEDEIEKRRYLAPYANRRVKVRVMVQTGTFVKISIQDDGPGFDHEAVLSKITSDDIYQAFGRGLVMLKGMADQLEYNKKGNCVYMTFNDPNAKITESTEDD